MLFFNKMAPDPTPCSNNDFGHSIFDKKGPPRFDDHEAGPKLDFLNYFRLSPTKHHNTVTTESVPIKTMEPHLKCFICGCTFVDAAKLECHLKMHSTLRKPSDCSKRKSCVDCCDAKPRKSSISKNKCKKVGPKPKNKNTHTKLVFKVGSEVVISKYCPKRFIGKKDPDVTDGNVDKNVQIQRDENCNEVSAKDQEELLKRMMAAQIVEQIYEQQQRMLRARYYEEEDSSFESEDESVVPELSNEMDVGVQELEPTRSDFKNSVSIQGNFEIITLDDDLSEDFEDDCVILDELPATEKTYSFQVTESTSSERKNFDLEVYAATPYGGMESRQGPVIKRSQLAIQLREMNF